MAMVTFNSGVLSHKSILKLAPQIHHKKFHKHNFTENGNRFKCSYNIQLIGKLNNPKRIVYALCSNEDSIEEDKAGREAKKEEKDVQGPGVEAALALLTFYKRDAHVWSGETESSKMNHGLVSVVTAEAEKFNWLLDFPGDYAPHYYSNILNHGDFPQSTLAFFNILLRGLSLPSNGEISPLLPSSCRYVPSCSEYSMQAYKRYGVLKGTVLTAWRLCRCNPLGGSGFDPPRWFDESKPPSP